MGEPVIVNEMNSCQSKKTYLKTICISLIVNSRNKIIIPQRQRDASKPTFTSMRIRPNRIRVCPSLLQVEMRDRFAKVDGVVADCEDASLGVHVEDFGGRGADAWDAYFLQVQARMTDFGVRLSLHIWTGMLASYRSKDRSVSIDWGNTTCRSKSGNMHASEAIHEKV